MNMIRSSSSLLAMLLAASVTIPAAAQTKYYARERIVGVPIQSSAPSYSAWSTGAWSARVCSGTTGTQTRTVTCSGSVCDPATKPVETQSAGTCTLSCGALTGNRVSQGGTSTVIGSYSSLASAQARCEQYAAADGRAGGCNWNNLSYSGAYRELRYAVGAAAPSTFGDNEFYSAVCSLK